MAEFTIDPEFRDLLPPLSDDEYQRLLEDIYNSRKKISYPLKTNALNAMQARNPANPDNSAQ